VAGEPDAGRLDADVDTAVRAFIRDGVALYGNGYRDLRYRYAIVDRNLVDDTAQVTIRYQGSARAVLGGQVVEAAGTAEAGFVWTGCRWRHTSLSY
jgi:hypothetical protein